MSKLGSYKTTAFNESQKFLVLDPSTSSASLVLASELVAYITPSINSVKAESTRLSAENTDYKVGELVQTSGATAIGDGLASVYLVVAGGSGDFPMLNGNDLLLIVGDDALRAQLISQTAGQGASKVSMEGGPTVEAAVTTVQAAVNNRVVIDDLINIQNISEYASFGANISGAVEILSHPGGSVVSDSAACPLGAYKAYQVKMVVTTTTPGRLKIEFDGSDIIYGDLPNGIYFSNAAILEDGTENNRPVTVDEYYFVADTSGSSYANLSVTTDLTWAGTVSSVEVKEITGPDFGLQITPSDGIGKNGPTGIRAGAYNRGDIALGTKTTGISLSFDGLSPTNAFNLAIGDSALSANFKGDQNTAIGTFALQGCEGSNNVGVGYSALKQMTKGQESTSVGYKSGISCTTGFRNVFMGFWAGSGITTGSNNVEIGWQPNTETGNRSNTTVVGYHTGELQADGSDSNVIVGGSSNRTGTPRILTGATTLGAESYTYDSYGVAVGFQSLSGVTTGGADGSVAIGRGAKAQAPGSPSCAIGDLAEADGDRAVSAGQSSKANGEQSVAVGGLAEANADFTTSIGAQAGRNNTGASNTFVGRAAGNTATNAFTNVTCLGQTSAITASNQVQLGNSATTTFAYGAVQDRSDKRDKADIKPLSDEQIAFFMDIEWRQFRMDYREDYDWKEKDGSKIRSRMHIGAIAQQVEAAMKKHNVDFAGLQHHSLSGGDDVYTIGYQEFIGLQGEVIQRQSKAISNLTDRMDKAGI
jgi:hypothetical protein